MNYDRNYELIKKYRDNLKKCGILPNDRMIRLSAANRSLGQINPDFPCERLNETDAANLYAQLQTFRTLLGNDDLTVYFSKLHFADLLCAQNNCSPELLLRFLADRSFYFAQYRELGDLQGGNGLDAAPNLESLLEDEIWEEAQKSPANLLQEGRTRLKWVEKVDKKYIKIAEKCFDNYLSYEPQIIITADQLKELFQQKVDDVSVDIDTIARLFAPYELVLENYSRIITVCENEWIPTTIHRTFWKETEKNYQQFVTIIQQRQDELRASDRCLNQLNSLANKLLTTTLELPAEAEKSVSSLVRLFETYVRSLLHMVRKKEYLPILTLSERPIEEKPYAKAIRKLLAVCYENGNWNHLTSILLYQAFAENTKVVLGNTKPKLVHKISVATRRAKVSSMTSMTGRRAGVNLVLYSRLRRMFNTDHAICLLGRSSREECARIPHTNKEIASRINIDSCPLHQTRTHKKHLCPFAHSVQKLNDFLFFLTTGYGYLYHHSDSNDTYKIPHSKIYSEKDDPELTEESVEDDPLYEIMRYQFNFTKPVGDLEGELRFHIQNCFPNRPRFLTPTTPNIYERESQDPFYSAFEELSTVLLQDMHLPAMQRICRIIRRILTEHPEYVEGYRKFLLYPIPQTEIVNYLNEIVKSHGLKQQILRYSSYQLSGRYYNINDTLLAIVEYELCARVFEKAQETISQLAYTVLDTKLFPY